MKKNLKMLIDSDRDGDWEGHLQVVKNCESDSINPFSTNVPLV